MHSTSEAPYEPLDRKGCRALADALGDTPETVQSIHLLRRGTCKAYVAGDLARFDGAIVQANDWPTEPTGFGSNPEVLWDLLQSVKGWECLLVDSECAPTLGRIIERELEVEIRYLDEVCHTLTQPARAFHDEAVRRLSPADLELLQAAPLELRAGLWSNPREMLLEGVIACAVIAGKIVATALTTAYSDRYADIGVYTAEGFRGRGYATVGASLVAKSVQESGRIPTWGAGEHNAASLRVAEKLGFVEVSRRRYVIVAQRAKERSP
jgi:RimJ/RimL family protein N-acetyltransferase